MHVGITFIQSNRPERLRDLLVAWLGAHPLAPLESETILVQSNGIAQWLKLALATDPDDDEAPGCGIAAGLDFLLPSRFLWQAYRSVLGAHAVPEVSPFDKERLVWRLMRLLPELLETDARYAPLRRFLAEDDDLRKRFQLAERLADLFDQYQVYRADWLAAWAEGSDALLPARGGAVALPEDQRWQPALWRALLRDVTRMGMGERAGPGRAAVHEAFVQAVRDGAVPVRPLPRRIVVFGISSLPRQSLEVLSALGRYSHVLLCLHNPCQHYWGDIVADKDLLRSARRLTRRRDGMPAELTPETLHQHAQPLLAAWGKQGRDFIALLEEYSTEHPDLHEVPQFEPGDTGTLLGQLQDDVLELRPLRETLAQWPPVDPAHDESIRFHLAHSPQREVEILHDQLLAAFNADPGLRPRDVIVMVPDIDVYAPHVQAVFGQIERGDPRYLPFSVVDQNRRAVDPLLHALEILLGLPHSRVAVSDVLDLLEVPALRARFGIAEADLPRLHAWIRGANVRWGLHGEHRAALGLPAAPAAAANSWLFGLRRMLLGYAVGAHSDAWQDIEPYDDVGGLDAALLGPLTRLFEALAGTWSRLCEPADVDTWCARLSELLHTFFLADGDDEGAYTLLRLQEALDDWQQAAAEAGLAETVPLSVVAEHWLAQMHETGLTQRFFAGAITFATLMPMRAIPFRRVCLLGMNDGAYPRTRPPLDFDLMGRDYRPGDRSRREDDRYLFLEALLSARDCLHISWVARSIHDNTERPPSVLVAQLREHLGAGWRLSDDAHSADDTVDTGGERLVAALTVAHPLQPFSPRYFPAQAEGPLYTYAAEWRVAAPAPAEADVPLPPHLRTEPLQLAELAEFLRAPVRAFFRHRLGVWLELADPVDEDHEPFALDGLARWQLQDELVRSEALARARGEDGLASRARTLARLQRCGELPEAGFGTAAAQALTAPLDALFARYEAALAPWPELAEDIAIDLDAGLPAGPPLHDWVQGLRSNGCGALARVVLDTSDVVKDGHYRLDRLVRHWVTHLACHLAGRPVTTEIVSKVGSATLPPLPEATARALLRDLLRAWGEGMQRPLPLAVRSAFAWLKGHDAAKARAEYEGGYQHDGERSDPYLARAYPDYAALTASGEFGELAEALLRPLHRAVYGDADPTGDAGATPARRARAGGRAQP
ncbi:exodeoxyribonuclease V subunit gamma [Verticiella sediminum]|uniref:RecBCD enzyme subunit RecC n=1 Tax=Verticiella sediminum TaxID=1247510 RepID=A0A556AYV9_9BURK|nr:exodeoxyribonuclease V subunit gamma [Verticiella sediminum]TSH98122.1 exodeoxyribonuclease V subunit gamma [Verticiella sediminum]